MHVFVFFPTMHVAERGVRLRSPTCPKEVPTSIDATLRPSRFLSSSELNMGLRALLGKASIEIPFAPRTSTSPLQWRRRTSSAEWRVAWWAGFGAATEAAAVAEFASFLSLSLLTPLLSSAGAMAFVFQFGPWATRSCCCLSLRNASSPAVVKTSVFHSARGNRRLGRKENSDEESVRDTCMGHVHAIKNNELEP